MTLPENYSATFKHRGQLAGRYQVIEKLGSGGTGTVYLCEDPRYNQKVAVKLFDELLRKSAGPDRIEKFLQDIVRLRDQVSDARYLVRILDVHRQDPPCVVMEYVEGKSLAEWLADRGAENPIDLPTVLHFIRQVAEGTQALHKLHFVHCDIHPNNLVILPGDRSLKMIDIGLPGQFLDGTPDIFHLFSHNNEDWTAPEIRNRGAVGYFTDIFLLGHLLDYLLQAADGWALPTRNEQSALRQALHPIVDRARQTDVTARYRSVEEFLAALREVDRIKGPGIGPPDLREPIRTTPRNTARATPPRKKRSLSPAPLKRLHVIFDRTAIDPVNFPGLLEEVDGVVEAEDEEPLEELLTASTPQTSRKKPKEHFNLGLRRQLAGALASLPEAGKIPLALWAFDDKSPLHAKTSSSASHLVPWKYLGNCPWEELPSRLEQPDLDYQPGYDVFDALDLVLHQVSQQQLTRGDLVLIVGDSPPPPHDRDDPLWQELAEKPPFANASRHSLAFCQALDTLEACGAAIGWLFPMPPPGFLPKQSYYDLYCQLRERILRALRQMERIPVHPWDPTGVSEEDGLTKVLGHLLDTLVLRQGRPTP